jgi:hypothetical protein
MKHFREWMNVSMSHDLKIPIMFVTSKSLGSNSTIATRLRKFLHLDPLQSLGSHHDKSYSNLLYDDVQRSLFDMIIHGEGKCH